MKDLKLPSVTKKELKKIRKKVFKVRGAHSCEHPPMFENVG